MNNITRRQIQELTAHLVRSAQRHGLQPWHTETEIFSAYAHDVGNDLEPRYAADMMGDAIRAACCSARMQLRTGGAK